MDLLSLQIKIDNLLKSESKYDLKNWIVNKRKLTTNKVQSK